MSRYVNFPGNTEGRTDTVLRLGRCADTQKRVLSPSQFDRSRFHFFRTLFSRKNKRICFSRNTYSTPKLETLSWPSVCQGFSLTSRPASTFTPAASKEYISCLRNYNHTADHCMERLSALKDEYKEYSAGLTNSNDVCCAYHSYHKCLGDKLSSGCGEEARQYTELYADKLTNKLLYNFCKNYETSVCVDTDSGSQLTMSVFTLLVATFVVQTASPTW